MKALVIYDSAYGNTELIAQTIAQTLRQGAEATVSRISDEPLPVLENYNLIVLGSPTQGGLPTQAMRQYLTDLPDEALEGKQVAAFDTRFAMNGHGIGLNLLMKTIGFAATRIATKLTLKGGTLLIPPEGFIVEEKTGPLKEGELERAEEWSKKLLVRMRKTIRRRSLLHPLHER